MFAHFVFVERQRTLLIVVDGVHIDQFTLQSVDLGFVFFALFLAFLHHLTVFFHTSFKIDSQLFEGLFEGQRCRQLIVQQRFRFFCIVQLLCDGGEFLLGFHQRCCRCFQSRFALVFVISKGCIVVGVQYARSARGDIRYMNNNNTTRRRSKINHNDTMYLDGRTFLLSLQLSCQFVIGRNQLAMVLRRSLVRLFQRLLRRQIGCFEISDSFHGTSQGHVGFFDCFLCRFLVQLWLHTSMHRYRHRYDPCK